MLCLTGFYLSQGSLFCCKRTYERNPAKNCATDASPGRAGECVVPITQEARFAFVRFGRADWRTRTSSLERRGTTEQHARWTCSRCSTCFEVELGHDVFVPFFRRHALQPLETGEPDQPFSCRSHVKEYRHGGSWYLWICAFFGAVSKGRSSSRKINFLLRKLWFWCLACDIALELVWMPTWARRIGPMHDCQSFHLQQPQFSHQPVPSRSWICSASHCRLRPIQRDNMCANMNPPVPSVVRKLNLLV